LGRSPSAWTKEPNGLDEQNDVDSVADSLGTAFAFHSDGELAQQAAEGIVHA